MRKSILATHLSKALARRGSRVLQIAALLQALAISCGGVESGAPAAAMDAANAQGGGPGADDAAGTTPDGTTGDAAPPVNCAGLGCTSCAGSTNNEICVSGATCTDDAGCASSLPGSCRVELGTYTADYLSAGCIGGVCVYRVIGGGCDESRTCDQCREFAKGQTCGLKGTGGECAACCERLYDGQGYAATFEACACGPTGPCAGECGTSVLCGGAGPETTACASCLAQTLVNGGACVTNATFQSVCIGGADGGIFCKKLSQCLATCPRT